MVGSGQCVAYAQINGFFIRGNANQWPKNAKISGYIVNKTPEIGAIVVTSESSAGTASGHVTGPIQKIDGDWLYVSEQNYVRKTITEGWINISLAVAIIHPK